MSGHECDEALTHIYLYLDRELEGVSVEEIRSHLDDCSGCLKRFDFEARLKVVIRERLSEEVPQDFIERLRQVLANETPLTG